METLKYSKDLIKTENRQIMAGFDMFIDGWPEPKSLEYGDKREWFDKLQGYNYAHEMAKESGISFIKPFKCGQSDTCFPFRYGGFFVCNSCGNKGVDKEWWKIKVEKDGAAFCCHGLNFLNLQESDNYAFGDTFEEAIENYQRVIITNGK